MSGIVFGIHRMALDDGPGIRTAVFLKGCMLHCPWCHNPESQKWGPEPMACKNGEFTTVGKEMTAEEVMAVVEQDLNHYRFTGGGVTLTGGDPLCQADFAREILTLAKEKGIHTCIETSGFGLENAVEMLHPFTDLWLFDLKGSPEIYRQIVGVDFTVAEKNLQYLLEQKASVILRCPIITGITDNDSWIDEICEFIQEKSKIHPFEDVHLLPFHRLGLDKYEALGRKSDMEAVYPPEEANMNRWNETIRKMLDKMKG